MSVVWQVEEHAGPSDQVDVKVYLDKDSSSDVYTYSMQVVDGEPYEPYCLEERWSRLNKRMKYKDGDIVICSFPKCGTTWMEQIVLLLLNNGRKEAMNPATKNTFQAQDNGAIGKIWLEASIEQDPEVQNRMGKQAVPVSWEEFDSMNVPNRVMKTHAFPATLLGTDHKGLDNLPKGVKVIIVTRNPFDACVSGYFYGFNAHKRGWPFEAWASLWLQGAVSMGDWFAWTKLWHDQHATHPDQCLWVSYEELLQQPRPQIGRIIDFLALANTPSGTSSSPSPAYSQLVDEIIALSSFSSMKAQAQERLAAVANAHVDQHLRKGECGDWRNHFSRQGDLYAAFVTKYRLILGDTGLRYQLTVKGEAEGEGEEWLE